jgi:hypothetical protein
MRWRIAREIPAVKKVFLVLLASPLILAPSLQAAEKALGWPELIDRLATERSQAEACVGLVKGNGEKDALGAAKSTYELAKTEMDGVIAGLTTVLAEGGKPENLPAVRDKLETAGQGLKQICDSAVRTTPANTKGAWEEVAKAAIDPLVKAITDGVDGLWSHKLEQDRLAFETKKSQLEAAKWPEFVNIAAR